MKERTPMRILNVLSVGRGRAADLLPRIVELQQGIGSEDFTFLMTTEPEQPPYLDKLAERLETFSWLREELEPYGVRSGILAQTTLGHAERSQLRSPAPYQRMVGVDGIEGEPFFCPLDQEFQQHLSAAIGQVATALPAYILIDDDFRLTHGGGALAQGCFCPLHLDLLSEMYGVRLSRDELLAAVASDTDDGLRLREQWRSVEAESLLRPARLIRAAIDAVDPTIASGLCATHSSRLLNDTIARALAGQNQPVVRIPNAVYGEGSAKTFPTHVDRMLRERRHLGDDVEVLTEADTYPQHLYSVSAKKLSALLTISVLTGIDGFKAWVVPTASWQGGENPQFVEAYARLATVHEALAPLARGIRWRGVSLPIADDEPHRLPWSATSGKVFLPAAWTEILGRLSLPHTPGGEDRPLRAINGIAAAGHSQEQWHEFLSGGVLLDGAAARILTDRGFADLIGVEATVDPDLYMSLEHYLDTPMNGAAAGLDHASAHPTAEGIARLTPVSNDTQVLGEYLSVPWRESDDRTVVSASVTSFANALGGRVVVYAADLAEVPSTIHFINPRRRAQLANVLPWLAPEEYPLTVETDTDLYLLVGDLPDDDGLITYALNLQADRIDTLPLSTTTPIGTIDQLEATTGQWVPAEWSATTNGAILTAALEHLDQLVLRIRH